MQTEYTSTDGLACQPRSTAPPDNCTSTPTEIQNTTVVVVVVVVTVVVVDIKQVKLSYAIY